jgi:mannan endo-1,4-beta-mannosidase
MRDWANYAKTQPDVWIEVWNEPYMWNNSNGYTDALWLADMKDMVDNIRSTGATNIILVPGNRQGQGEEAILNQGKNLLTGRSNILFDLHAYER